MSECPFCLKFFGKTHENQVYCSSKCRVNFGVRRWQKDNAENFRAYQKKYFAEHKEKQYFAQLKSLAKRFGYTLTKNGVELK